MVGLLSGFDLGPVTVVVIVEKLVALGFSLMSLPVVGEYGGIVNAMCGQLPFILLCLNVADLFRDGE